VERAGKYMHYSLSRTSLLVLLFRLHPNPPRHPRTSGLTSHYGAREKHDST
jgi:hypothetical protein